MIWEDLERHFSAARLGRYRTHNGGDVKRAAADYERNMSLTEAMLPLLNVLEIALRNGIHDRLSETYSRPDWWEELADVEDFSWQYNQIQKAKRALKKRNEKRTPDKIIAELNFGFWISLFNAAFANTLWKSLRLVFPRCPKDQRQRNVVSRALNQTRDLRNRAFHHEPLLWLTPSALKHHQTGMLIIEWIDPKLAEWLRERDRFLGIWTQRSS